MVLSLGVKVKRFPEASNIGEMNGEVTLIVGEALGSKTSLLKEAKTRLLPYVGIGTGSALLVTRLG